MTRPHTYLPFAVAQGVVDQIGERLLEPGAISLDDEVRVGVDAKPPATRRGVAAETPADRGEEIGDWNSRSSPRRIKPAIFASSSTIRTRIGSQPDWRPKMNAR